MSQAALWNLEEIIDADIRCEEILGISSGLCSIGNYLSHVAFNLPDDAKGRFHGEVRKEIKLCTVEVFNAKKETIILLQTNAMGKFPASIYSESSGDFGKDAELREAIDYLHRSLKLLTEDVTRMIKKKKII